MARKKMNWSWVEGVRCIVFSTFCTNGVYSVQIMLGEAHTSPTDPPWRKGTVTCCKSHHDAFKAAEKFAKQALLSDSLEGSRCNSIN